ncbi:hypothetical protein [uncultured Microscilla sp.]|uniref:hypothetical protein n=1 Tax=uncultured Microscilla sp. TaxID=432653 RepID=UPI00262294D1|nr:hypothetical protein [uncultured Microscilla sp.]
MKHLIKTAWLCLLLLWTSYGYTQVSKQKLMKAFDQYQALVAGKGQVCHAANAVVGDLNGDGVQDGIVQYTCLMAGGNIPVYTGWTLWLNEKGVIKPVLHCKDLGRALPLSIGAGGIISALVYKYKKGDASCCPSIKTPKKYQLKQQKIISTIYYELEEVK